MNGIEEQSGVKKKKIIILFVLLILIVLLSIILCNWYNNKKNIGYGDTVKVEEITYTNDQNGIPKFITGSFSNKKVNNKDDALIALNDIKDLLKMKDPTQELILDYQETNNDVTYYRFNQVYQEIYVLNQNIIIAVDKNGNILSFSGYYIPNIDIDTTAKLSKEEVNNIFLKEMGNGAKVIKNELYIWDNNGSADLVYVINGYSDTKIAEYIIDANSGEIISVDNTIHNAEVYPYTGEGMDNKFYTINLEEFFDLGSLKNRYRFHDSVRNISVADYRYTGPVLSTFLSAVPGTTPIVVDLSGSKIDMTWESESFIQNAITTMANYEAIYDYYKNVLGRNSYNNKGSEIIINLGVTSSTFSSEDLMNAFWCSLTNQMYIGNYNGKSFSASLDVLGHEFTHGVVDFTAKFASKAKKEDKNKAFETGALNEGYADVLGSLIEGKNWTIAENNEILRSAVNPTAYKNAAVKGGQYYFPDGYITDESLLEDFLKANNFKTAADYDNGGVHANSNVVYHAAYLMNDAFSNMEEMAKVWYSSLLTLSSYSNFEDCALAVINAAKLKGLNDSSIYKITQAFIDTKMLEEKNYDVKGKVRSGLKLLDNVLVSVYSVKDNSLIMTTNTDKDGYYNLNLQTGVYELTFAKDGFQNVKVQIVVEGNKTLNVTLKSNNIKSKKPVKEENNVLKNACKTDNCYNVTIYFLESKNNKLEENYKTYAVEANSSFDLKSLTETLNKTLGNNMVTTDGKSFYISMAGFKVECGWYYKDTDIQFDFTKPITKDIEIEMKLFDGNLDNSDLTNIFDIFNN